MFCVKYPYCFAIILNKNKVGKIGINKGKTTVLAVFPIGPLEGIFRRNAPIAPQAACPHRQKQSTGLFFSEILTDFSLLVRIPLFFRRIIKEQYFTIPLLYDCDGCSKKNNTKTLDFLFYSALRAEFYFYFVKVLLNPHGFSYIIFAYLSVRSTIPLGISRISLRSNITRQRRI